ncbi:Uncharacterized protein dnm_095450 [Desulfonema magnum]|uniref:Uncharacterized protein n=1 Tax=Desulfonema magnum TaxID=45655 RepID=A0A975BYR6_9BACT|nr:Uncharacterized protein dnm_095450 [Desulfonema magnum]
MFVLNHPSERYLPLPQFQYEACLILSDLKCGITSCFC